MSLMSSLVAVASQAAPKLSSRVLASSGYTLDPSTLGGDDAFSVWTRSTAERQDRSWQPIVEAAKAGKPREDVEALWEALADVTGPGVTTILEVGCGGGYNSELIKAKYPSLDYTGVDISNAMIAIASDHYPDRRFAVGSAYELDAADSSSDIVVDGVALIHMPGWQRALGEYARVASTNVILHGLTLTDDSPTTRFAKYAYGQPAIEYVFSRAELLDVCTGLGLSLITRHGGLDYDLKRYIGVRSVSETWVMSAGA